ncbi:MAG: hypothetical protein ABFR53_13095, partial [Actinomycetota bacterium]
DARCQMPDEASRVMLSGSERSERSAIWYLEASPRAIWYLEASAASDLASGIWKRAQRAI